MAEVPRNPEELRLSIAAALGITPERCGQEQVLEAYRYALACTWERMEAVVGTLGARAILEHAVKIASTRYPAVALVTVGDYGPDLVKLEAELASNPVQLCRCLRELYLATFLTLQKLTGQVVVGPLLDEIRHRQAGGGGA